MGKQLYIATDRSIDEFQKVFESKEDCIKFCKENYGWGWTTIPFVSTMSNENKERPMSAEEIIQLIKGRIEGEQRKHSTLDWTYIAAGKIYSQWFEYFNLQTIELKNELEKWQQDYSDLQNVNINYKGKSDKMREALENIESMLNGSDSAVEGVWKIAYETLKSLEAEDGN